MISNLNKSDYAKNIQRGLAIALLLMIFLFYSFPEYREESQPTLLYDHPEIIMIEIPHTRQPAQSKRPRPMPPSIPIPADEAEILDELTLEIPDLQQGLHLPALSNVLQAGELPFIPRQVLEVVPENPDLQVSGEITLSLRIGVDGKVKEHRLISNSTQSDNCLKTVLDAAYKSRWQIITIDEKNYEYWIEKTYRFD